MKMRYKGQLLLIVLAVFMVFGQTMGHEFVRWDDPDLIFGNPYVYPFQLQRVLGAWARPHMHLYVPLTYNAWALLGWVGRTSTPDAVDSFLNAYLFHTANLILHCFSAIVVFRILLLLLKRPWFAVAGAILWAIHPFQVEPVAWATGMKDILSGNLALLALWSHLAATSRPDASSKRTVALHIASAALLALSGVAKPGGIGIPFFAIACDWLILRRPLLRSVLASIPMFLAVIPATVMTAVAQPVLGFGGTIWDRPLIAGHALSVYLQKLIWPDTFSIDYGLRPAWVLQTTWSHFAWIVPVALTVVILANKAWRKPALCGWLIFLAGVGPVLGLTPFLFQVYSTVADRYVYLSLLGPALVLAWVLQKLPPRLAITMAIALLLCFGVRSAIQVTTWAETHVLMEHTLAINPRSFIARNVLAAELIRQSHEIRAADLNRRGIIATDVALRQPPTDEESRATYAKADAIEDNAERMLREALEIWPDYHLALNNLSVLQMRHDRLLDALDSLERAEYAIEHYPIGNPVVMMDRLTLAKAAFNLKRYQRAADGARTYLARYPDSVEARELVQKAEAALRDSTQPTTEP
jgi:hypothetical protein